MQTVNRLNPAMDTAAYQTYSITAPPDTILRSACEEVERRAKRSA